MMFVVAYPILGIAFILVVVAQLSNNSGVRNKCLVSLMAMITLLGIITMALNNEIAGWRALYAHSTHTVSQNLNDPIHFKTENVIAVRGSDTWHLFTWEWDKTKAKPTVDYIKPSDSP